MEQQVIPSDYTQYAEAVEIIKHAIERCRYRSAAAVNKGTILSRLAFHIILKS
nr:hypothetical protein [Bacteroides sp.]